MAVEWLNILLHVWEIVFMNLCPETNYPDDFIVESIAFHFYCLSECIGWKKYWVGRLFYTNRLLEWVDRVCSRTRLACRAIVIMRCLEFVEWMVPCFRAQTAKMPQRKKRVLLKGGQGKTCGGPALYTLPYKSVDTGVTHNSSILGDFLTQRGSAAG